MFHTSKQNNIIRNNNLTPRSEIWYLEATLNTREFRHFEANTNTSKRKSTTSKQQSNTSKQNLILRSKRLILRSNINTSKQNRYFNRWLHLLRNMNFILAREVCTGQHDVTCPTMSADTAPRLACGVRRFWTDSSNHAMHELNGLQQPCSLDKCAEGNSQKLQHSNEVSELALDVFLSMASSSTLLDRF